MVRSTIRLNTKLERMKMVRSGKPKVNIEAIMLKKGEFQLKLQNRSENFPVEENENDVQKPSLRP